MKRLLSAALIAATSFVAEAGAALSAPTINVMVVQEDWDPDSLSRNTRSQIAVLSQFNAVLNAPAYRSELARYGIEGMEVYDETSLTLEFYGRDRARRTDQELIALARQIPQPDLDVLVPFTLYARAVTDPYTHVAKLQMSLNYRALSVRDGRYLGGDNLDLDTSGIPFTGCAAQRAGVAADSHCVTEFVAENGEKLARIAGNKLAIQLTALLGKVAPPAPNLAPTTAGAAALIIHTASTGETCQNIPATYSVTFRGFETRQINAIEQSVANWSCAMDMNVTDSAFSDITFSYKTRADEQRLLRNIRLMSELMGVVTEARLEGANHIVVEALNLRHD